MALVARTNGDVDMTTRSMQKLVHEFDPTLPTFDVRSMRGDAGQVDVARIVIHDDRTRRVAAAGDGLTSLA